MELSPLSKIFHLAACDNGGKNIILILSTRTKGRLATLESSFDGIRFVLKKIIMNRYIIHYISRSLLMLSS